MSRSVLSGGSGQVNDARSSVRYWLDQFRLWPSRVLGRRRVRRVVLEQIGSRIFVVLPEVFNPAVFRSGRVLADYIASAPNLIARGPNPTALDLGTGCGVQAVFAALRGFKVTASDINPHAVRCARANVLLNRVEDSVRVLEGDLFDPVEGEEFDLVIFNPPFFRGAPKDAFDLAWRSIDGVERFAAGLSGALRTDGLALIMWSSHADVARLLDALRGAGLQVSTAHTHRAPAEVMTILEARR